MKSAPSVFDHISEQLSTIPERLASLFLCAVVPVVIMLVLKSYQPYIAVLATLVLFALSLRFVPAGYRRDHPSALGAVIAVEFVAAWIWVNAPYYEQELSVYRDPSIYALRGWWLAHHSSPLIDMSGSVAGASGVPGASVSAGGFPVRGDTAYPQAASLVPGLLGVAGRVGGLRVMLAANLLIAGIGLLCLYGLARRLMGPLWGLPPVIGLAASMPMVYFSRASYTEPTALTAVFAGLLLVANALERKRRWLLFVAGLTVGVSALARIDGLLAVSGGLLGLMIAAAAAADPERRAFLRLGAVSFFLGGFIVAILGWYDLKYDSPAYYASQAADLRHLFELLIAVFVVGLAMTFVPLDRVREHVVEHRAGLATIAFWSVIAICLVMASRPLWWVGRFNTSAIGQTALAHRQQGAGLTVDPTRSYDEQTVTWLSWYLTWPVVILAAIGLGLLLMRAITERHAIALVAVTTIAAASMLYLNLVSITPDQIWASRRLLPVTFPGLLLAAGYVAYWVAQRYRAPWVSASLALLVAAGPALPWRYVFMQPEFGGELRAVDAACAAVHKGSGPADEAHVVVAGSVPQTGWWLPTIRIVCGAAVVAVPAASPDVLTRVKANWGEPPIVVISFSADSVTWSTPNDPRPAYAGTVQLWIQPLTTYPRAISVLPMTFYAGTVASNGRVEPLPP